MNPSIRQVTEGEPEMNRIPGVSRPLQVELWTLYPIGLLFILSRTFVMSQYQFQLLCPSMSCWLSTRIARRMHFGSFRKFQIDDYIMLFIIVRYSSCYLWRSRCSWNFRSFHLLEFSSVAFKLRRITAVTYISATTNPIHLPPRNWEMWFGVAKWHLCLKSS